MEATTTSQVKSQATIKGKDLLFEVNVYVQNRAGKAAVELRSLTGDINIIKALVTAAYHDQPLIIMPKFSSKLRSLNQLQQLKILKYDFEDDKYYWTV